MGEYIDFEYTLSKTGIGLSNPLKEPMFLGISYNKRHVMVNTKVDVDKIDDIFVPRSVYELTSYDSENLVATAYERFELNVRKEFGEQLKIKNLEARLFFRK